MSPNNGILLYDVLKPKLLNVLFASCSFIDLDLSLPHAARFDDNIVLPFLVFNKFESTYFFSFFYISNNMSTCFIMTYV